MVTTIPGQSTSPSTTGITVTTREGLEEAAGKILASLNCKNVLTEDVPPITTWEQTQEYLRVVSNQGKSGQGLLEAWFFGRTGVQHDPLMRGTYTQYQQLHSCRIIGWAWHKTFSRSYQYIQNKTEELLWTLEKNKGFSTGLVEEIRDISTRFNFTRFQGGENSLYTSETRFSALVTRVESAGRI
tara:strand:- start:4943 stop:5497 length:555 start_codon:yes stop_codon:yes gene_type:complete